MAEFKLLEVNLRNRNLSEQRTLRFNINTEDIAQIWAARLEQDLQRGSRVVKNFFFHGWPIQRRPLAFLLAEMNRHIGIVNGFFRTHPTLPYSIDLEFSLEKLNREQLNLIHHHFELFIGQRWNYSPYYLAADRRIRYSIIQINYLCHEIEPMLLGRQGRFGNYQSHLVCTWVLPELMMMERDYYKNFSPKLEWGDVYLHYSQLGKDHIEAFLDQDENIGDENITGIQYLSGEFDINFKTVNFADKNAGLFREWLKRKSLNPDDGTLGIGYCMVAKIEGGKLSGSALDTFMSDLYRMDELAEIRLISDQGETVRSYAGYDWDDSDYDQIMAESYEEPVNMPRPNLGSRESETNRGAVTGPTT